jgi:dTDP-4-dehydrorhamnose reductase
LKVLITGAGGMVGHAAVAHCESRGDHVLAVTHRDLDIADKQATEAAITGSRPDVVINCAAWTDVDGCERDQARAFNVNAAGPENLALACRKASALLITISTDYVFSGDKDGFYTQRDDPDAVSVYGKSKIEGERRAVAACARTIVVRSGWIFGPYGKNFLSKVIELGARHERLTAIGDAYGTPTYALDLVKRLRQLAEVDIPGIYHVVNSGEGTSFEGFVRESFDLAGFDASRVSSVRMDSLDRPAPRPRNSRLRCLLSEAIGLPMLPLWSDALKDFVSLAGH